MDNSRTFTKKDQDRMLKIFEEMSDAAKELVTTLQGAAVSIDNARNVLSDIKTSSVPTMDMRRTFIDCIKNYLVLNGVSCRATYPFGIDTYMEIRYYDGFGNLRTKLRTGQELITLIDWNEVTDLGVLLKTTIKYIDDYVLYSD